MTDFILRGGYHDIFTFKIKFLHRQVPFKLILLYDISNMWITGDGKVVEYDTNALIYREIKYTFLGITISNMCDGKGKICFNYYFQFLECLFWITYQKYDGMIISLLNYIHKNIFP